MFVDGDDMAICLMLFAVSFHRMEGGNGAKMVSAGSYIPSWGAAFSFPTREM